MYSIVRFYYIVRCITSSACFFIQTLRKDRFQNNSNLNITCSSLSIKPNRVGEIVTFTFAKNETKQNFFLLHLNSTEKQLYMKIDVFEPSDKPGIHEASVRSGSTIWDRCLDLASIYSALRSYPLTNAPPINRSLFVVCRR